MYTDLEATEPHHLFSLSHAGQVPQFGYSDEVDMTELVHIRAMLREKLHEQGIKFSYMPVIIKALSLSLHQYPILNATVNPECTTITEKVDHNIGVAMDTSEGLVVPNVKQVQVGNEVIGMSLWGFLNILLCTLMYNQCTCAST